MSQARCSVIGSPARLQALRRLALLDSPVEPAFDHLTQLAARVLKAPMALVSLVDEERQFFKSSVGLSEPWATLRQVPLSYSFCQHAVDSRAPLLIDDARTHPLVQDSPAIPDLKIIAYAGIPLITRDGHALGAFCATDSVPRVWTSDEVAILESLATAVIAEIELRAEIAERKQAETTARRLADQRKRLLEVAQTVVSTLALDEIVPQLQHTLREILEHDSVGIYWLDEEAGVLRPAHTVAPPWLGDQASTWAIPLSSGIAGAVGRSGRAELVNDAHLDPRAIYPPGTTSAPVHHLMCIPIRTNHLIRGVFMMSRNEGSPFTEQEFDLVQLFVSYAALAIQNARLFEQTRESEERFAKVFHASPVAITITSAPTGRFVDVNDAFLNLMGYGRDEVIGRTTIEMKAWANPEERTRVVQALREQQSIQSMELAFRTKSGAVLDTLASMEIIDLEGERCILSMTQDITERKRIEQTLREREALIRAIGDDLPDGMIYQVTRTPEGSTRFTYASAGIEKLWGITAEQLCENPRSIQEKYYEADRASFWAAADESWRTLTPFDIEIRRYAPDGTLRWSHLRSQPQRFDDGRVVWNGVEIDITAHKQAEQEQQRLIGELQEALANVKSLRGLLPICSSCKKIRDDHGYWNQIEIYIKTHSEADFTHGICPDCVKRLYGKLYDE